MNAPSKTWNNLLGSDRHFSTSEFSVQLMVASIGRKTVVIVTRVGTAFVWWVHQMEHLHYEFCFRASSTPGPANRAVHGIRSTSYSWLRFILKFHSVVPPQGKFPRIIDQEAVLCIPKSANKMEWVSEKEKSFGLNQKGKFLIHTLLYYYCDVC